MSKILIVDDEVNVVELVKYNLELHNFEADTAYSGQEALDKIINNHYDLVVLDNMLPEFNGFEIIKIIRNNEKRKYLPILMLTAKSEESDIVFGLNLGADDYMTKPFRVYELIARVKSLLRRSNYHIEHVNQFEFNDFTVDEDKHEVKINDELVKFTKKEFELLLYLIKNKNRLLTREKILEEIWGYDYYGETRTVDVHILNIRKKIEPNPKEPKYLHTIIGSGYKFVAGEKL